MEGIRDQALSVDALLLSRSYLYRLFAKVLSGEPDGALVAALAAPATQDVLDEYAEEDEAIDSLKAYLASFASFVDDEAAIEDARSEYTRVFVGPSRLPALPWSSSYESRDPAMFQRGTIEVRAVYRSCGLQPVRVQHIPDDHIAFECAFMDHVAGELLAAFEEGDIGGSLSMLGAQREFVTRRLASWLPQYAAELTSSKKAPFYARLVLGLAAFVRIDGVFLGEAWEWLAKESAADEQGASKVLRSLSAEFSSVRSTWSELSSLAPKFSDDYALVATP